MIDKTKCCTCKSFSLDNLFISNSWWFIFNSKWLSAPCKRDWNELRWHTEFTCSSLGSCTCTGQCTVNDRVVRTSDASTNNPVRIRLHTKMMYRLRRTQYRTTAPRPWLAHENARLRIMLYTDDCATPDSQTVVYQIYYIIQYRR